MDTGGSEPAAVLQARKRQVRLLFGLRLMTQAVRMVWAPLVVYIAQDPAYNLPASRRGHILSSFSLGYLMTQIAGGMLADKYGGAPLSELALFVDGATMVLAPFAGAMMGVSGLASCYFVMGIFSGLVHPAYNKILAAWVPQKDIGGASTLGEAGAVAGTLLSITVSPFVALYFGWSWVCYSFGIMTLAFALVWRQAAASKPPNNTLATSLGIDLPAIHEKGKKGSPEASADAVEQGDADTAAGQAAPTLPPFDVLLHWPMWAVIFQHVCYNGHRYFFVEWMPTYMDEEFGMPPSRSSFYLSICEILGVCAPMVVGKVEDYLIRTRSWSLLSSRRFFGAVGFGGMALVVSQMARLGTAMRQESLGAATLQVVGDGAPATAEGADAAKIALGQRWIWSFMMFMTLNPVCYTMHSCGYKSNYMDLTKIYSGIFMGFGNTFASIMTWFMPLAVGMILTYSSGDWTPAFWALCLLDITAVVVSLTLTSVERIDKWLLANDMEALPRCSRAFCYGIIMLVLSLGLLYMVTSQPSDD